jgi:uncharacterized protein with PIN domain
VPTVIDASALAAVLYDEPEAPAVLAGCETALMTLDTRLAAAADGRR